MKNGASDLPWFTYIGFFNSWRLDWQGIQGKYNQLARMGLSSTLNVVYDNTPLFRGILPALQVSHESWLFPKNNGPDPKSSAKKSHTMKNSDRNVPFGRPFNRRNFSGFQWNRSSRARSARRTQVVEGEWLVGNSPRWFKGSFGEFPAPKCRNINSAGHRYFLVILARHFGDEGHVFKKLWNRLG